MERLNFVRLYFIDHPSFEILHYYNNQFDSIIVLLGCLTKSESLSP